MAKQFCPRAGAVICAHDCDTTIWQTTLRSELETCQRCEHGRALMATIIIASRRHQETVVDDATLTAAGRALPLALGYVLPRYPQQQLHGVRFLAIVAENKFGYRGSAEAIGEVALSVGLHITQRHGLQYVLVDNNARQLAGLAEGMPAYYNENNPFAAAWLRELIKARHIAPGEVDTRSIADVMPNDVAGFTQCHFFAGIGVWSYALRRAGWSDDRPVWTGSCPCQPFSSSGKQRGFKDERHLWPEFYRLISECRPPVCFGEQVASKPGLAWLDLVQTDLENAGYAVGAVDTCSAGVGSPHLRQRLYWVADCNCRGFMNIF